ncbi:MAG: DUF87 domain-containing protein, partial [Victivallales bacterium]|nr:DUF87 domain-containing protein [Victivallales bacterium]
EIQLNINRIQQTMDNFKLDATVINAIPGPQITLYEIELGPKTLVKKFAELKHNICLELRSQARLLLPIPNKHTVGIEVPNKKRITVTARELFDSDVWRSSRAQIPIMLGKNIKNETMLFDLVSAPHMLVAGTTGSGKSVCMNLMLQSLLMRFSPDELKLIMFDPKVLEFQPYANLPHLLAPIINQPSKMGLVLRWLINEMERRFIMLGDIGGVRKLSEFNSRPKSDTPQYDRYGNEIPDRLPYIVVFIDELADIMLQNAKEVDMALARLAGKARAAGIHMIIATQRPDAKTVNGLIKSNIPWRTALKVAGSVNSRIIIDQIGAETLLGNGDMLFMGDRDLERIQGGWVSNSEIDNVVKFCCSQGGPVFDSSLVMALESQDNEEDEGSSGGFGGGDGGYGGGSAPAGGGGGQSADGDDRIAQALEIIRASKRATISHLQRRMGIGYNKAADLVDELESLGYLGPQPPSGTREIYWDNFPKNDFAAFADADADNAYDDGQDFDSAEDDEPPFA